ncbi:MAG: aldose 1-epimerase family protein [Cyclobacteriaceae bacterium]
MKAETLIPDWRDKVSNAAQIGGIETSVADNGAARGSRMAWLTTGGGLRFKLLPDRCLDIGEMFYGQHSLAWLSHKGFTPPNDAAFQGIHWLRSFGGGFLTTCGLSNVGVPNQDAFGERGLHGDISNCPAEVNVVIQPDLTSPEPVMQISGIIRESRVFGPHLELRRKITALLGQASFRLQDEVINRGNETSPHMLLYHLNFGWPLVDEGASLLWKGAWQAREEDSPIFREGRDFRKCLSPLQDHAGAGEDVAFIDPAADQDGYYQCGVHNQALGIALKMRFRKDQLPCLTNWQHWGQREYVTALEPGTNFPIGQARARQEGSLIMLEPGQSRHYDLHFEILDQQAEIENFLSHILK